MPERAALPIAILPLDRSGEKIAQSLLRSVRDTGSTLVQGAWFRVLDRWDPAQYDLFVGGLEEFLAEEDRRRRTPYRNISGLNRQVMLLPLGSLVAGEDDLAQRFAALVGKTAGYHDGQLLRSLLWLPVFDVAYFGDEERDLDGFLRGVSDASTEAGIRATVLLADSYGPGGVQCDCREELQEAIRLYLEALVLGHHWESFANAWYRPTEGPPGTTFATFAVHALRSPTAELCEYLSHVGFYETVEWLNSTPDEESRSTMGEYEQVGYDWTEAGNPPPIRQIRSRDLFFQAKRYIRQQLAEYRERYEREFAQWQSTLRADLPDCETALLTGTTRALRNYREQQRQMEEEVVRQPRVLWSMRRHGQQLEAYARQLEDAGKDGGAWKVFPRDPLKGLGIRFAKVRELVSALPNSVSLVVYIGVAVALQLLLTRNSIELVSEYDMYSRYLFYIVLAIWSGGTVYLAWRLPSWRIARHFRQEVARFCRAAVQRVLDLHRTLRRQLTNHWNIKGQRAVANWCRERVAQLRLVPQYLVKAASEERERFPPDGYRRQLEADESNFLELCNRGEDIEALASELHEEPEKLGEATMDDEAWRQALGSGDALQAERALRAVVQAYYAGIAPQEAELDEQRLRDICTRWAGGQQHLLLRVPEPVLAEAISSERYVFHETWQEVFREVLGERQVDEKHVGLGTLDRVYLIRTCHDLDLGDLLSQGEGGDAP